MGHNKQSDVHSPIADLAVLDDFADIIENSSDAILTRDADKRISSWNKGAEAMLGYKREEVLGKTAHELGMIRFTPDEMREVDEALSKCGVWKAEKKYYHRNGKRLYGAVSANAMRDASGNIGSVVFIVRDITVQKELENQLKKYNQELEERVEQKTREVIRHTRRYRAIFENNNDLTSLIDAEGCIIYQSPSAERTTGWNNTELHALNTLQSLIHPDDLEGFRKRLDIAKTNPGQPIDNLYRVRHKDGHYITQKGTITNFLHNEDIKAIIINSKDITELVEREQELRRNRDRLFERERLLALYIEHSPAAIAMFDMNMHYLVVSRRWIKDYQLKGQDLVGRSHYEVFPEITDELKAIHQRGLKGISDRNEEYLFVRSNGNQVWVRWEVLPWYHVSGEIGGILIFTEDITKRKRAEEHISQSEHKYRSLVDRVSDGFVSLDTNYSFNFVNPIAAGMFGRTASEMIGKNFWNEFPESIGSATSEAINLAMRTQKHVRLNEIAISGGRWVEANLYPSLTGLSIYLRDITRQHNALQAARHSEAYRKKIMGSALDAIICTSQDEVITSCNAQALRMFGFDEAEIIGKKLTDTIIPEKFRQRHSAGVKHYLATGEGPIMNRLVEVSALNKAGEEFPIELFIVPIEEKGEQSFCAFIRDITVRKQTEGEMLKTQNRFIQAEQIGHMGHWEIDILHKRSRWSDEAYRIYGLEPDDHNISQEEWMAFVHPDDRANVEKEIARGMERWQGSSFHYRIIRKDGSIRYLYAEYRYDLGADGHPTSMYGIVHDITDQKELELQLQEQQRKELLHLSAATLAAQEKERNAIGRELHDNVNQILVGSLLVLSMIKKKPEQSEEYAAMAIENLQLAVNENRKIAHELVAPDFAKEDLICQLEKLTNTMLQPAGIRTRIDVEKFDETLLSDAQKLALYRVAQEQCTNIIKYSEAKNAGIEISSTGGLLYMQIADDGKGAEANTGTEGIGLKNMISRVSVFNGTVAVRTAPGEGFAVEVGFPLSTK